MAQPINKHKEMDKNRHSFAKRSTVYMLKETTQEMLVSCHTVKYSLSFLSFLKFLFSKIQKNKISVILDLFEIQNKKTKTLYFVLQTRDIAWILELELSQTEPKIQFKIV
jgi:hypothetical protein